MRKFFPNLFRLVSGVITVAKAISSTEDIDTVKNITALMEITGGTIRSSNEASVGSTGVNDSNHILQLVGASNPALGISNAKGASRKEIMLYYDTGSDKAVLHSYDYGVAAFKDIDIYCDKFMIYGVEQPRRKVFDIGDWNMDTGSTTYVAITHGLTISQIVGVTAIIRNDDDSIRLTMSQDYLTGVTSFGIGSITPTVVNLACNGNLGTSYNATSYNRGHIIIDYLP